MRPPWNCLPSCRPLWTDIYPTDVIWQWRDEWKSDPVVNSLLMDDATIRQPGFDLPRCHWALLNCFRPNQGHCASCRKKWGLAATDMCPCSNRQTMLHMVYCTDQAGGWAAVIARSWWRCHWTVEDIRLINALGNNNSHFAAILHTCAPS